MILLPADRNADASAVSAGRIMAIEVGREKPVDGDVHAMGAACRLTQRGSHVPLLRAAFRGVPDAPACWR